MLLKGNWLSRNKYKLRLYCDLVLHNEKIKWRRSKRRRKNFAIGEFLLNRFSIPIFPDDKYLGSRSIAFFARSDIFVSWTSLKSSCMSLKYQFIRQTHAACDMHWRLRSYFRTKKGITSRTNAHFKLWFQVLFRSLPVNSFRH